MRMGASLMKGAADGRRYGGLPRNGTRCIACCVILNCIANKARDQVWNLGDQAMKKVTGGCLQ